MALKPTIYKANIALSDMDRNHYDTLTLTIAQHPSENLERMMARLLAFCINAQENLIFSKGLSTPDEPDIWARSLDDQLRLWIDLGEPDAQRIKKASRIADQVRVYSFNSKSDVWWELEGKKFSGLKVEVYQFEWQQVQALALLVSRTMDLSVTITDATAYISAEKGDCVVSWRALQAE